MGTAGPSLTEREREVAGLITDGLTDRAIARRLFISSRTAEGHVRQILNKLGFDKRSQIASWMTEVRLGAGPAEAGPRPRPVKGNLPVQVTSFVGRERELAELPRLLRRTRALTIAGPGGAGKTRLAVEVARLVRDRYPAGAWFVDLGSVTDPNVVPRSIASALGVREREGADPLQAIATELAGRRRPPPALVLLDNCEHLVERCAATVLALLQSAPDLTFLCTGREPLHIPGEAIWRLDPPSLPEGEALFLDRVSLTDQRFSLDDAMAREVANLCRRLDVIPLALELAAARVGLMPFDQVLRHLEDRFSDLRIRGLPSRQQTLSATLDWSYDLLSEPERDLLRRLSVFAGGFTEEAVEAVCMDGSGGDTATLRLLARLVDRSLVMPVPPRTRRYRCLEIIRRDARSRLGALGEVRALRRRHLDYFLHLAEQAAAGLVGPEQSSWLERLTDDHDNLRAALETSRSDDLERRLRLVHALSRFWTLRGLAGEGRQWMEEALAAAGGAAVSPLRALVHNAAGGFCFELGDLASARRHVEAALAQWAELNEPLRIQPCLAALGVVAAAQGDWDSARAWSAEGLALARELDDRRAVAVAAGNLGVVLSQVGQHGAALAHLDEALEIHRENGDQLRVGVTLANLGTLAVARDRPSEAGMRYRDSLEVLTALGTRHNVAECLEGFAWLAAKAGDVERAMRLAGAASVLRDDSGLPAPPASRRLVEDWLESAQATLGGAGTRAWEEGRALPLERAIASALASLD